MADISKININNTSYDLKDAKVRQDLNNEILYYVNQTVSSMPNGGQIMRIPSGNATTTLITESTVVLECTFEDPSKIISDVSWTSYSTGYITFTGVTQSATKANVTLGTSKK